MSVRVSGRKDATGLGCSDLMGTIRGRFSPGCRTPPGYTSPRFALCSRFGNMDLNVLKLDNELPTPTRAHQDDAGLDLRARYPVQLEPGERVTVGTGVALAIPSGHAGLVMARSGLASRYGVGLVNSPGLIDAGYRGEIRVVLVNLGRQRVDIARGDRIAQLVVVPVLIAGVAVVESLDSSSRGVKGFGSSGQ